MPLTNLEIEIVEAARGAVLLGRKVWGTESEIREEYLSALIATQLHTKLNHIARTEIDYTQIYKSFSNPDFPPEQLRELIGSLRADVVIYERSVSGESRPGAIIDVKKFRENCSVKSIGLEFAKGNSLRLSDHVSMYVCIFICETARHNLEKQQELLQEELDRQHASGGEIMFSSPDDSLDGQWRWCVACVKKA